jgi:hypothetical protein
MPIDSEDDSEPLTGGDGVRYRWVAELADLGEAARLASELQETCRRGGVNRASGAA